MGREAGVRGARPQKSRADACQSQWLQPPEAGAPAGPPALKPCTYTCDTQRSHHICPPCSPAACHTHLEGGQQVHEPERRLNKLGGTPGRGRRAQRPRVRALLLLRAARQRQHDARGGHRARQALGARHLVAAGTLRGGFWCVGCRAGVISKGGGRRQTAGRDGGLGRCGAPCHTPRRPRGSSMPLVLPRGLRLGIRFYEQPPLHQPQRTAHSAQRTLPYAMSPPW